jgi:hypothetical protein
MRSRIVANLYLLATLTVLATVYLLSISPYVGGGDSGELIVTAANLATPHPPGYPIYAFFAHLFTWIPFSTIAWRVGFFSVICQLAASVLLYQLLQRWLKRRDLAAVLTLFFGLSTLVWRYAIDAEVFALNNLLAISFLYVIYMYLETRSLRWIYLACFTLGIACCHQLTVLLLAIPFCIYFLWVERRTLFQPRIFLQGLGLFCLGLMPYLYLFYLGQNRSLIAWGELSNWQGFFTHVLRREYGFFQLAHDGVENAGFLSKIYYFLREMGFQTLGVMALAWMFALCRLRRLSVFPWLLLSALLFYTLIFQALSNLDLSIGLYYCTQARMWILPLLLILLLGGWGLAQLLTVVRWKPLPGILNAVLLIAIALNVIWQWRVQDQSENDFFERVGRSMLTTAEPRAVILMREDAFVNALRYLQTIKNLRPDVHVIPYDALWWPWLKPIVEQQIPGFVVPAQVMRVVPQDGAFILKDLLNANIDHFPIYVAKITKSEGQPLEKVFSGYPCGFQSRVLRDGQPWTLDDFHRQADAFINLELPDPATYPRESWEAYVVENYIQVKIAMAKILTRNSQERPAWLLTAAELLRQVAPIAGELRPSVLRDMGNTYGLLASKNPVYRGPAAQAWEAYLATHPAETPELSNLRAVLRESHRINGSTDP